ncbi:MAG: ABC transporter ATP-binding protein [Synergistales bacterium]|nr:ABC transporter ATP-binding protein [Synergistales bacterium]
MTQESLLTIRGLKTQFFTRKGVVPAVDGLDLDVERGRITGIVGESGCGKSVTALSILGLIPGPAGRIVEGRMLFEGEDLVRKSYAQMSAIRGRDISMIFQEPMTALNPVYRVGRQVGEPLRVHSNLSGEEIRERVIEMLDLVGIPDPGSRYHAFPHQLSGGLRQRVMIAMALICDPKLLIADEPTTALDVTIQAQILELMKRLMRRLDTSIILITHDLGVVAEVCDEVHVMYAGKVVECGDVYDIFDAPAHPYTRGLIQSIPGVRETRAGGRLYNIEGMVPPLLNLPSGCRFAPRCDRAGPQCRRSVPELLPVGDGHLVRCWKAGEGRRCAG